MRSALSRSGRGARPPLDLSSRFHAWVVSAGSWRLAGLLLVGCAALLTLRQLLLSRNAQIDPWRVPDARLSYTAGDIRDYWERIGPSGCRLYAATLLTLDLLMPVLYGGLLAGLIARVCPAGFGRRWIWVPVGAAAADIGENNLLAYLAVTFHGGASDLAWVAACLTAAKWALAAAAILGLVLGALWQAVNRRHFYR